MSPERFNAIWEELRRLPITHRMAMVQALVHEAIIDVPGTMIDAGYFDPVARREVYLVGAIGPDADVLRLAVAGVPEDWPVFVGWDPGYDHPTAILWVAVAPNGTYYVIDEVYQGGLAVGAHCRNVHARNAGRTVRRYFGDPQHCFSQTAQSPESIATQARKHGISLTPWPRTARPPASRPTTDSTHRPPATGGPTMEGVS